MLWLLATAVSYSQTPAAPATDEIVVFGDPFARWNGTRWLVESSWVNPMGLSLRANDGAEFEAGALRTRAVLACEIDGAIGPKQREVECRIEELAMQAVPLQDWVSEGTIDDVLGELDAKLTGAILQLQVSESGSVNNVDIEGIKTRTRRERLALEQLRSITVVLVSTYHMRVKPTDQWVERNSAVQTVPSSTGTQGSGTLTHTMAQSDGQWVVQSLGTAMASVPLTGNTTLGGMVGQMDAAAAAPDGVIVRLMPNSTTEDTQLLIDGAWELETTGVALVDPDVGYMVERVSVTVGTPTASNPLQQPMWIQGQLRKLEPTEHPSVGPTGPGIRAPASPM